MYYFLVLDPQRSRQGGRRPNCWQCTWRNTSAFDNSWQCQWTDRSAAITGNSLL